MAAAYAHGANLYQFDNADLDVDYDVSDVNNENKNTKRKTETDMRIFSAYLISLKEMRKAEDIPPQELDPYLSTFFSVVKKHDGNEYEPASLRGMLCSIERYLRMKGYQNSVTRDAAFHSTRNTLKNKQRILRENGKGMKKLVPGVGPDPLGPSTLEKLNHLYAAKELGPYNPSSVINSLCFAFVLYFRMRKAIDHKQLLWGDIVLRSGGTSEYLCYEPLEGKEYLRVKLKGIEDCRVWSNSATGPNKDPILIYKLYSQKRPTQMMQPDSPFYLGVSTSHPVHSQPWYKSLPMGVNKLNDLVRMIRDITGIQKAQSISNPSSPEDVKQSMSPSLGHYPCLDMGNVQVKESSKQEDEQNKYIGRQNEGSGDGGSHGSYQSSGTCSEQTPVTRNDSLDSEGQLTIDNTASLEDVNHDVNRRTVDTEDSRDMAVDLSCVDKVESSYNQSVDSSEPNKPLEAVKSAIHDLFRTLDRSSRIQLVKWMNNVELEAAGGHLVESGRRNSHFQIMIDLDSEDLTREQQIRNLTGRIKLVNEPTDAVRSRHCKDGPVALESNLQKHDGVSDLKYGVDENIRDTDDRVQYNINNDKGSEESVGLPTELKNWPSPLKRSVSERISDTANYLEQTKRFKVSRRNSFQDTDSNKESSDMKANSVNVEGGHGERAENNVYQRQSGSDRTEVVENTNDLNSVKGEELKSTETRIQPPIYSPHWIPSHMFHQIAHYPLTSYTDPRWLQLCSSSRKNTELPSMESVFRQPFDTNLLRRVYASSNLATCTTTHSAQNSTQTSNDASVTGPQPGYAQTVIHHVAQEDPNSEKQGNPKVSQNSSSYL